MRNSDKRSSTGIFASWERWMSQKDIYVRKCTGNCWYFDRLFGASPVVDSGWFPFVSRTCVNFLAPSLRLLPGRAIVVTVKSSPEIPHSYSG